MANNCIFSMKVLGSKENIEQLYAVLLFYTDGNLIVGDTWSSQSDHNDAIIDGDCRWSVEYALMDKQRFNLPQKTKELDLVVEIYSQENDFQEHYIINRGEIIASHCADYAEFDLSVFRTHEEAERALDMEITEDEWNEYHDDWLPRGGFGDWIFNIEHY